MALGEKISAIEFGLLPNLRHKMLLQEALDAVCRSAEAVRRQDPFELAAITIREAVDALGRILGVAVTDDVLEDIFSRFCIGK